MKKFLLFLFSVTATAIFAAEKLSWNCEDIQTLKTAVNAPETSAYDKVRYSVNIAYLENPEIFKTYADLKTFTELKAKEYGVDSSTFKTIAAQQVYYRYAKFRGFSKDGFAEVQHDRHGFYWVLWRFNDLNLSALEAWRYISSYIIEQQLAKDSLMMALRFMLNHDLRVPRTEKIEVYQTIYEKYLPQLADEQNVVAEKKIFAPFLGKLALKLKALGVEVIK